MMRYRPWFNVFIASLLLGCAHQAAVFTHVSSWPDAGRLFRSNPFWLGGDGAYSVVLDPGRILWLFGDSLIDPAGSWSRTNAHIIRNSVAIQTGCDPSLADISFHWAEGPDGAPEDFFEAPAPYWYWPGCGMRIGDMLLVFLMKMKSTTTRLGFESAGTDILIVEGIDSPPGEWEMRKSSLPEPTASILAGPASMIAVDGHILVYAADRRSRDIHLARFTPEQLCGTQPPEPEFRTTNGWTGSSLLSVPVIRNGQMEFSVHRDSTTGLFIQVQTKDFIDQSITMRTSRTAHGPFSNPVTIFRPEEGSTPGILVYAAKAHPELCSTGTAITYATNSTDSGIFFTEKDLYYPVFLRLSTGKQK